MTTCKCPHCGEEISPASLLGKGKKKTMSEKAISARKENGKKGGRPKKNKDASKVDREQELSTTGRG